MRYLFWSGRLHQVDAARSILLRSTWEYDIAYRINLIDNDFSPPCFDLSLQIFGFTESSDKEYVLCREQDFSEYVRDEGNKPTFGRARR